MSFRSLVAAALLAVGVGQASDAATIVGWRDAYGTPHPVYREAYDVDLYFDQGYIGGADNPIEAWGIYNKETPVSMRIMVDWFEPDYWADVSVSSRGQDWSIIGSALQMNGNFIASGSNPNGEAFTLELSRFSDFAGYIDLADQAGSYYDWALLSVENVRLAPVPIPATAALLPLGLGALAMMRKRRRAVS